MQYCHHIILLKLLFKLLLMKNSNKIYCRQ